MNFGQSNNFANAANNQFNTGPANSGFGFASSGFGQASQGFSQQNQGFGGFAQKGPAQSQGFGGGGFAQKQTQFQQSNFGGNAAGKGGFQKKQFSTGHKQQQFANGQPQDQAGPNQNQGFGFKQNQGFGQNNQPSNAAGFLSNSNFQMSKAKSKQFTLNKKATSLVAQPTQSFQGGGGGFMQPNQQAQGGFMAKHNASQNSGGFAASTGFLQNGGGFANGGFAGLSGAKQNFGKQDGSVPNQMNGGNSGSRQSSKGKGQGGAQQKVNSFNSGQGQGPFMGQQASNQGFNQGMSKGFGLFNGGSGFAGSMPQQLAGSPGQNGHFQSQNSKTKQQKSGSFHKQNSQDSKLNKPISNGFGNQGGKVLNFQQSQQSQQPKQGQKGGLSFKQHLQSKSQDKFKNMINSLSSPSEVKPINLTQVNAEAKGDKIAASKSKAQPSQKNDEEDYYDQDEEGEDDYDNEEYGEEERSHSDGSSEAAATKETQKIQPCLHHLQGQCRFGDTCNSAHIKLDQPIPDDVCLRHTLGIYCKWGANCSKRHDDQLKTQLAPKLQEAVNLVQENKKLQKPKKPLQAIQKPSFELTSQQILEKNKNKNLNLLLGPAPSAPVAPAPSQIVMPVQLKFKPVQKAPSVAGCLNQPAAVQQRLEAIQQQFLEVWQAPASALYPGKAVCLYMCDPEQLNDPGRQRSPFERDHDNENFQILAVKRYNRSDAGKEMNNPENIRPPRILNLTMKYLRDVIIDQDLVPAGQSMFSYLEDHQDKSQAVHKFMDIYSFMKDRTRQLSQDMNIANLAPTRDSVECLEQIARYLIVSMHDGFSERDFDLYTNLKQITGALGDLDQKQYKLVKEEDAQLLKQNQAEMYAYQIISSAISEIEYTKLLVAVKQMQFSPEQMVFVREAISISTAVQMLDFQRFFKMFKKTNYMFACLMLQYFHTMRERALAAFRGSLGTRQGGQLIRGDFIQSTLLLPNKEDCFNCLTAFGFEPDPSTCNFLPSNRKAQDVWSVSVKKFRQQDLPLLDSKRDLSATKLRKDYVEHGLKIAAVDPELLEKIIQDQARQAEERRLKVERDRQAHEQQKQRQQEQLRLEEQARQQSLKMAAHNFRALRSRVLKLLIKQVLVSAKEVRPVLDEQRREDEERLRLEQLRRMQEIKRRQEEERRQKLILYQQIKVQNQKHQFSKLLQDLNRRNIAIHGLRRARQRAFAKWKEQAKRISAAHALSLERQALTQFDRYLESSLARQAPSVPSLPPVDLVFSGKLSIQSPVNSLDLSPLIAQISAQRHSDLQYKIKLIDLTPEESEQQTQTFAKQIDKVLRELKHEGVKVQPVSTDLNDLFRGGFSLGVLVVDAAAIDLGFFIKAVNSKAAKLAQAQMSLSIIVLSDKKDCGVTAKLQDGLKVCLQNRFLASLNIFEVAINSSTLQAQSLARSLDDTEMESFIKNFVTISLNQQSFGAKISKSVTLVYESPSALPPGTQYPLASLMQYVCNNLTFMLSDKSTQPPNTHDQTIEVFNCYLLQLKKCLRELQRLLCSCAKHEFHFRFDDRRGSGLASSKCVDLVEQLLNIAYIPKPKLHPLEERHVEYLYTNVFSSKLPLTASSVLPPHSTDSGQQLFQHFAQQLSNHILRQDLFLEVFTSLVSPLGQPDATAISDLKTELQTELSSSDVSQVEIQLKRAFPRDFGQSILAKRALPSCTWRVEARLLSAEQPSVQLKKREAKQVEKELKHQQVVDSANFDELFRKVARETRGSEQAHQARPVQVDLTLEPLQHIKILERKLKRQTFSLDEDFLDFGSKFGEDRDESTAQSPSYSHVVLDDDPFGLQKARELEALIINLESYN